MERVTLTVQLQAIALFETCMRKSFIRYDTLPSSFDNIISVFVSTGFLERLLGEVTLSVYVESFIGSLL